MKSGISYVHNGKSIDRGGNTYTFHNDVKNNKYGTVDMNGVRQDNSQIIYGKDYTIFGTSDNSCDASTLHGNLLGTSYTGGDNPKDYLSNDSYQYMPRNMSEYGSMIHDLMYDAAGAKGVDGALFDYRQEVIDADKKLVQYNMINVLISPSFKDKGRSALTVGTFGIIVGAKSAANAIDNAYNKAVDAYGRFTNAIKDAFSPSQWFK